MGQVGPTLSVENCHFSNLYSRTANLISSDGSCKVIFKNVTIENVYTTEKGLFTLNGLTSTVFLRNSFIKNVTCGQDGGIFWILQGHNILLDYVIGISISSNAGGLAYCDT